MPYTDYLLIPLRRVDKTIRAHAIIDKTDAALAQYRWCLRHGGYAHRNTPDGHVMLHRVILGLVPGDGLEGDHIDGNTLDCRRTNLRIVTRAENNQNILRLDGTSAYRGVHWDKRCKRWCAQVTHGGTAVFLGRYDDELEAAEAALAFRAVHKPFANESRRKPSDHRQDHSSPRPT